MNIVDVNVAIVATATASFLAAYDIKDKKTVEALSEAFVGFAEKWYTENNKPFDLKNEMLCEDAIVYAVSGIAQAHEMAVAVSKMMSFGK
jgi:hypothetical protein